MNGLTPKIEGRSAPAAGACRRPGAASGVPFTLPFVRWACALRGTAMSNLIRRVLALQGTLYLVTGLWPIVHMRSFEWITGPKNDDWLVYTVGLLLAVIGCVLLTNSRHDHRGDIIGLAAGTAIVLAAIETFYVAAVTISPVYLLDTIVELSFVAALVYAFHRELRERAEAPLPARRASPT
jgi:hypothetical protein